MLFYDLFGVDRRLRTNSYKIGNIYALGLIVH